MEKRCVTRQVCVTAEHRPRFCQDLVIALIRVLQKAERRAKIDHGLPALTNIFRVVGLKTGAQPMKFRTARPSDAPILAAISIEVWLGTYIKKGLNQFFAEFALNEFTSAKLSALIEDQNQHFIVSESADGLDGFIRISQGQEAPVAGCSNTEIATLYVRPCHHGKGLGKALLAQGLADAASVWLTTNSENALALSFYLKQGFEKVGTTQFRIQDQAYMNDVLRYGSVDNGCAN